MANLPPPPVGIPPPPNGDDDEEEEEDDDEEEDEEDPAERTQRLKEEAYVRVLHRIGIRGDSLLDYLRVHQGQVSMDTLATLSPTAIQTMVTTVNKTVNPQARAQRGAISFFVINAVSLQKLLGLRDWIKWRRAMGTNIDADQFNEQWMQWTIERLDYEARIKTSTSETTALPDPLKGTSHKSWIPFWRQFENYCHTIRGTLNIPISYVFRESLIRSHDVFSDEYTTSDEALMDCVALSGTFFNEDNARLWGILESVTCNGNAFPFIKRFQKKRDGRGAILALKAQCEGDAATATRKLVAYNLYTSTKYDGKGSRYTFDSYVEKLQFAFSELEECGDPQSESHKIHILCTHCTAPIMQSGCDKVEDDADRFTTFAAASEFLKGHAARKQSKLQPSIDRRNVSFTETGPDDYSDLKEHYPRAAWIKLPQATKNRVMQRNRERKANGTATPTPKRRNVKKLKSQSSETEDHVESDGGTTSDDTQKTRKVSGTKADKNKDE